MARFIEGIDRHQVTLFPDRPEDWIDEDNPVRVADAFVDALDLNGLDFARRGVRDGASGLSPIGSSEALHLRLSEPRSVEPPAMANLNRLTIQLAHSPRPTASAI